MPEEHSAAASVLPDSFVPKKMAVQTTAGTLYVRGLSLGNVETLGLDSVPGPAERGELALSALVNTSPDVKDSSPLPAETRKELTPPDVQALACAIAKLCHLKELTSDDPLAELGELLRKKVEHDRRQADSLLGSVTVRVDSKLKGILGEATRHKISDSIFRFANLTAQLEPKAIQPVTATQPEPTLPTPPALIAAQSTVQELQQIRGLTAALSQQVTSFIEVYGVDVLSEIARGAKWGLRVALVTLAASVVAAVAVGWWQISETRRLASDADAAQRATLVILQEQLAAQRQLIEQQARDAVELRAALKALSPSSAAKSEE